MKSNRIEVQCAVCGKTFTRTPYYIIKNKRHFCSLKCRRSRVEVQCDQCHKIFSRIPSNLKGKHHFCSHACMFEWRNQHRGQVSTLSGNWAGGKTKTKLGYITKTIFPDNFFYPMADKYGRVLEHRLLMAEYLHRCLLPWEIVHHKNGIKNDNRIENLELFPSSFKHYGLTKLCRQIEKLSLRMEKLERENKLLKWRIGELEKERCTTTWR